MSGIVRVMGYLVLLLGGLYAQESGPANPTHPLEGLDFSNDPCGSPLVESQIWIQIDGHVVRIVDASTFEIELTGTKERVRVQIAGVKTEEHGEIADEALRYLTSALLDQNVDVLVNPGDWWYGKAPPTHAIGVVFSRVAPQEDIGRALISRGLARYKEPPPYTMSRYTSCHYQLNEKEAKVKSVGLWRYTF